MQDDSIKRRKKCQEISDDYHKKVYDLIVKFWLEEEIKNPDSSFYKESKIEVLIKKIYPKSRQNILNIAKAYKFSILEKGKCYYTQQSLAKHFKITQQRVSEVQSKLEQILDTKFIIFPSKIINPTINKKSSGIKVLIPPILYKLLLHYEDNTVLEEDNTVQRVDNTVQKDRIRESLGNLRYLILTYYLPINNYFSYTFLLRKKDIQKISYIVSEKTPETINNFTSKVLEFKMPQKFELKRKSSIKKYKLNRKPIEIITYNDYKLHPKQFASHVESLRILGKWFDEVINANISPKFEETNKIIQKWNNIGDKRFSRVKAFSNKKSKTYYLTNLAISYRIWSMKLTVDKILQGIDNFVAFTNGGRLKYKKKIHLLTDFLWNDKRFTGRDHFVLSLKEKGKALDEYYGANTKYKNSLDYVRRYYGITFLEGSTKENRELFNSNYKLFVDFTNVFVEAHMTKDMIKFYDPNSKLEGFKKLIKAYFDYAENLTSHSNNPYSKLPINILGTRMKVNFISYMKGQDGWRNFWVDLEKDEAQ